MEPKDSNKVKEKMANIYTQIAEREEKTTEISDITYYKELAFGSAGFLENGAFVVKLRDNAEGKEGIELYEIYNEVGELIATTDEQGKLQLTPEYIEKLRQDYKEHFETLELEEATLELPEKLKEQDVQLTHEELDAEVEKTKDKQKEEKKIEKVDDEKQQVEEIAVKKGIPANNVLVVRDNSNLYKDHPEIERNLIFSRDNDGLVKAEYIDENGELQPSKYIMPSTTGMRQETVSIGSDGEPVTREVPKQVMRTQNLSRRDQDIKDIRFNIKFDTYGYMDIEEARQGSNGEWSAHDIEVRGRNYNSSEVNETTSIKTGSADPNKETETYSSVEKTGLVKDGVQYDEMYLMQHSEDVIEGFIKEGYKRKEAIQIFNYMIGEETLTQEEAKGRVDKEIKEMDKKSIEGDGDEEIPVGDGDEEIPVGDARKIEERKNNKEKDEKSRDENEDEGRTPWGDAEARDARR